MMDFGSFSSILLVLHAIFPSTLALLPNKPNDIAPGTIGYRYLYDCTGDAVACQQMCFYFYCAGRTNYVEKWDEQDLKEGTKQNRGTNGFKFRPFNQPNIPGYGTSVVDPINTTPDEWPPASSKQGGPGSILMGHGTEYHRQGARIKDMWSKIEKSGQRQGWVEPYNWDPTLSPACNCKPNWPQHRYTNPYTDQCNCDNDIMRGHQYILTKDRSQGGPEFENYGFPTDWGNKSWNAKGYRPQRARSDEDKAEARAGAKVERGSDAPSTDVSPASPLIPVAA